MWMRAAIDNSNLEVSVFCKFLSGRSKQRYRGFFVSGILSRGVWQKSKHVVFASLRFSTQRRTQIVFKIKMFFIPCSHQKSILERLLYHHCLAHLVQADPTLEDLLFKLFTDASSSRRLGVRLETNLFGQGIQFYALLKLRRAFTIMRTSPLFL